VTCLNIASTLLAEARGRQRELAIRTSAGSGARALDGAHPYSPGYQRPHPCRALAGAVSARAIAARATPAPGLPPRLPTGLLHGNGSNLSLLK
jgi:hypothetical protein